MSARALLIGAGSIGAHYDLSNDSVVITHARAYERRGVPFDILDPDPERAAPVAHRYGGVHYRDAADLDPSRYAAVSICSPTSSHAQYLALFLGLDTPLIFCEKPVAATLAELAGLTPRYRASRSLVIVNYLRRFLPAYARCRANIRSLGQGSRLQSAVIRYQRGFLNNGGHALDLLEYLFDAAIDLGRLRIDELSPGPNPGDATISGMFEFSGAPVALIGFPTDRNGIFEIELNFDDRRLQLLERGDRIVAWRLGGPGTPGLVRDPDSSEDDCLEDYMGPVFDFGYRSLAGGDRSAGNFERACRLNAEILSALERRHG